MTRQTTSLLFILCAFLASCGMAGSKRGGGPEGPTITFVDPVDDQLITPEDDLNDDESDQIQYSVVVSVTDIPANVEIVLHQVHDTVGGEWEHTVLTDESDTVTFTPVTFWEGTGGEPSIYSLRAYTADGVTSETITVDIASPIGTSLPSDAVMDWEIHCVECEEDPDCRDGLTCPTREACSYSPYAEKKCCYEVEMSCDEDVADPCLMGICSEAMGGCILIPVDRDGDGHAAIQNEGTECGGTDCDDGDYTVHPGALETCDSRDNDCDWAVDEDAWIAAGDPLDLSILDEVPSSASLASGDAVWGVAWIADTSTGRELRAGVITPGGPEPVESITTVETFDDLPLDAIIVPAGLGFAILVVVPWWEGHAIIAYQMNSAGVVDSTGYDVATSHTSIMDLTAAPSPDRDKIGVFYRTTAEGDYEIFYLYIDWPDTSPPVAGGFVRITYSIGFSGWPSAVGTETGFAVAWEDDRDGNMEIYFAMLAGDGALDGPASRVTRAPGNSQNVALGWSPEGTIEGETIPESYGLVWMDSRAGGYDLLFTCLDGSGSSTCPEIGIGPGPDVSWYPALTYQGHPGQFAMAYAGRHDDSFQVHSTAVSTRARAVPADIDAGPTLNDGGAAVSGTDIADAWTAASISRGVLWIEGGPGTSILRFQQLSCKE